MTHDRDETSGARDVRMLAPPLGIGKIRRVVSVPERSVSAPISTMTTRAISPEQIDDSSRTPFRLRLRLRTLEQVDNFLLPLEEGEGFSITGNKTTSSYCFRPLANFVAYPGPLPKGGRVLPQLISLRNCALLAEHRHKSAI